MTDNTQPEALRALAEAAKWTGKWYDAGCNTVYCTYDKAGSILHDEIAHPVPFGVSGYIAAAHPQAVIALLDRIAELESELEAVGVGGVSGPLMGQPQAMPDLSALTERGAKAWTAVDAQGLREGFTAADMATAEARGFRDVAASAMAGEPMAWMTFTEEGDPDMVFLDRLEACQYCEDDDPPKPLYLAAPPTAQAEGVIAESALRKVLAAVQRYMPPDGPDAKDTLSEIIAIVDPWPLGPLEKS